jgi:nucleotide-binding universal stress UspA family protein
MARDRELHVATVDDDGAVAYEIAAEGCRLLHSEFGLRAEPENVVSIEPVADALLERRDKLGAGLIVVGGYVPSPLARLVWGSVTHGILEKSVVPVFLHY